jgi:hypothetical protein
MTIHSNRNNCESKWETKASRRGRRGRWSRWSTSSRESWWRGRRGRWSRWSEARETLSFTVKNIH